MGNAGIEPATISLQGTLFFQLSQWVSGKFEEVVRSAIHKCERAGVHPCSRDRINGAAASCLVDFPSGNTHGSRGRPMTLSPSSAGCQEGCKTLGPVVEELLLNWLAPY